MTEARVSAKVSRSEHENADDQEESRNAGLKASKMKRHDIELPMAEADLKLAEKLDNCLKISGARKARFFMNKPKASPESIDKNVHVNETSMGSIKPKNLTREELRKRLLEKYDTLVPELDPKRTSVKLVKVLSAKESLEMGKEEARKQLVSQMKLNSISGNQRAYVDGIDSFRFNDGYELPCKNFYSKKFDAFQRSKNGSSKTARSRVEEIDEVDQVRTTTNSKAGTVKSVKFVDQLDVDETSDKAPNPYDFFVPDDDDDDYDDDDDILTEADENNKQEDSDATSGKRDV